MKFGVREICDVVFKAKADVTIGSTTFKKGQPVLYIDTAKTSTIEGAATTVYAQGGKGNTRLIAWEGEKTLTFTVEDALLSPIGFSVLSGAGLFKGAASTEKVHRHMTTTALASNGSIELIDAVGKTEGGKAAKTICDQAPIFVVKVEEDGSIAADDALTVSAVDAETAIITVDETFSGMVLVDYYIIEDGTTISELQIDAANFAGFYYVEASTLFRRQDTGEDMPAEITFPNVKIQSNFTFTMASSGDPSTFTFTMDAFPGVTYFNPTKKVLCVIQIVDDSLSTKSDLTSVMPHDLEGDKNDEPEELKKWADSYTGTVKTGVHTDSVE